MHGRKNKENCALKLVDLISQFGCTFVHFYTFHKQGYSGKINFLYFNGRHPVALLLLDKMVRLFSPNTTVTNEILIH